MSPPPNSVGKGDMFLVNPSAAFVCLSGQILLPVLPRYLMNTLNNFDKTDREYLLAPADDLFRFWRSEVEVVAGRQSGEGIHVDAGALKSTSFSFFRFWIISVEFMKYA